MRNAEQSRYDVDTEQSRIKVSDLSKVISSGISQETGKRPRLGSLYEDFNGTMTGTWILRYKC